MHEQMSKRILSGNDNWLAAEFALGVLNKRDMAKAEAKYHSEIAFRHTVDDWHMQFEPMLDDVKDVMPNKAVWKNINDAIGNKPYAEANGGGGIWKLFTALASTAAVAAIGALMLVTGGDFTGQRLKNLEQNLASTQSDLSQANDQLASAKKDARENLSELAVAKDELLAAQNKLASAQAEVSEIKRSIEETSPLVASLSQSGDAPSFIATYDPLKSALLIRTTLEDDTEKVPEIWLIPSGGPREGDVLSLGVMREDIPEEIKLSDQLVPLLTEGGTLAITMEPVGGAPNGVATGPIIALGKLQALKQ